MARNYGLAAQLNSLNYYSLCKQRLPGGGGPRWVLADLARAEIQVLEESSRQTSLGQSNWLSPLKEVRR